MIYEKQIASNSKGKFIEVEKTTGDALEVFLFEKNIIDEIDHNIHSDPTANCDILFTELAMQNNCKCSRIKFNKRKYLSRSGKRDLHVNRKNGNWVWHRMLLKAFCWSFKKN